MENIDIQQIESYLWDKMTPDERSKFEAALAADPELRQRTEELRLFAQNIRQVGREDIRKRVEAVSNRVRWTERMRKLLPKIVGTLLLAVLLWLGYLYYEGRHAAPPTPVPTPGQIIITDTGHMAENQNKRPDDRLGQTAKKAFFDVEIAPRDGAGNEVAPKIRVQIFRDPTEHTIYYKFSKKENQLIFYLPPEKDIPIPPQLAARNGKIFIRMEDGSERVLPETETSIPL